MKIAIFSAFPQEIKHILKKLRDVKSFRKQPFPLFIGEYSSRTIILMVAGVGARNAEAGCRYVLKEHSPDSVLSVGFGGALYDGAKIGEVVIGSKVLFFREGITETLELPWSSVVLGKLSAGHSIREGSILTLDKLIKKSHIKKMISPELPFPVCDMETFFPAKISLEQGLRFFALRSITDRADEEVPPELIAVTDEAGKYKLSRALRILCRPGLVKDVVRFGRSSGIASKNLSDAVGALIETL